MIAPKDISFLPEDPGCYLFRDDEKVIYVGKAKNIKKRVSSYFQKTSLDPKTSLLVSKIKEIDYFITPSEAESLLLENNLIKKHYPKYNLDLKDSRRYAYLMLHDDTLPWIEVARTRGEKGEYYGPFVSGSMRKIIFDIVTRTFRLLTKKPSPRLRKLLEPAEYAARVKQARMILKGNADPLIKELEKSMNESSEKKNYEYALSLRKQIEALKSLKEKQVMEMARATDAHAINYSVYGGEVFLIVFTARKGVLEEKQDYSFEYYPEFFEDFLLRYYDEFPVPKELIIPEKITPAFGEYLSMRRKGRVSIIVPQKGGKKGLLDLVSHNIKATFFAGNESMASLQEILRLDELPAYIECFDISHLSGTNTVASMAAFSNGLPDKSSYRRFRIQTAKGGDDYRAMREVVRRRYAGSLRNRMKTPDLIVIDGGPGQLSSAMASLREIGQDIPVISLAKRLEGIYTPKGGPILLERKHKGLQLLQAIRDEAHRFAITYQRLLREKQMKDEIHG